MNQKFDDLPAGDNRTMLFLERDLPPALGGTREKLYLTEHEGSSAWHGGVSAKKWSYKVPSVIAAQDWLFDGMAGGGLPRNTKFFTEQQGESPIILLETDGDVGDWAVFMISVSNEDDRYYSAPGSWCRHRETAFFHFTPESAIKHITDLGENKPTWSVLGIDNGKETRWISNENCMYEPEEEKLFHHAKQCYSDANALEMQALGLSMLEAAKLRQNAVDLRKMAKAAENQANDSRNERHYGRAMAVLTQRRFA